MKKFDVKGMSCAACAAGIERVTRAVKGVNNAEVSLMGKCMTVDYDGNAETENEFLAAVKKLGYTIGDYKNVTADRDKAVFVVYNLSSRADVFRYGRNVGAARAAARILSYIAGGVRARADSDKL